MNSTWCTWDIESPMMVTVRDKHKVEILRIGICEIIESSSRKDVLSHVAACDGTPWLIRWNNEKHEALIKVLKNEN